MSCEHTHACDRGHGWECYFCHVPLDPNAWQKGPLWFWVDDYYGYVKLVVT
jgi:hypothetical protein